MKILFIGIIVALSFIPLSAFASETFVQQASAEFIRGENYEVTQTIVGDELQATWRSAPTWLYDSAEYQPFIFDDTNTHLIVQTSYGSIKLDKSTCEFSFYNDGLINNNDNALFSDSIIAKIANDGTEDWTQIDSVNNAVCQPSWDGKQLTAKKQSATGILEYKYITNGISWKTQLEATNLSGQTNKKFGFDQIININTDSINYAGQSRDIDSLSGSSFDRTFLVNNQAKIIDLLTNVRFDFDLAFDNLNQVSVFDTGSNKSQLVFDYTFNSPLVLPNQTLILDPTFSYTAGTDKTTGSAVISGATCVDSGHASSGNFWIRLEDDATSNRCYTSSFEWDITSIPNTATIDDANFRINVTTVVNARNCDIMPMAIQPSVATEDQHWDDTLDGTAYVDNNSWCTTTGDQKVISLASAISDIESQLASDWFAIGLKYDDMTRDSVDHQVFDNADANSGELEIQYTVPVEAISDLSCAFNSDPTDYSVDCDWTQPTGSGLIGYQILRDLGGGREVLLNNTASLDTFYNDTRIDHVTDYSISFWAKTNFDFGSTALLFAKGDAVNTDGLYVSISSLEQLSLSVSNVATTDEMRLAQGSGDISDGMWHHYFIAKQQGFGDGSEFTWWRDGVVTSSVPAFDNLSELPTNNKALTFGAESDGGKIFTGQLDDIRIFDQALTPATYTSFSPIASYQFENNLLDGSGNGNHGTATGGELYVAGNNGQAFDFDGTNYITILNPARFDFAPSVWHEYDVRAWGDSGLGPVSNLQNVTTIDQVNTVVTSNRGVVGDVLGTNYTATVTGFPTHEATQVKTFVNASLTDTGVLADFTNGFGNITDWFLLGTGTTTVRHQMTIENFTGGTVVVNSNQINEVREYDPDYFPARVASEGNVNYTQARLNNQDTVQLKVNREKLGATFQIECLFQTASQAQFANQTGTWVNQTNVGWLNATVPGYQNTNAYISCYNDELLFITTSYTNGTLSLAGIQAFDDIYGGFIGVPVVVFFLVLIAGYASPRTSPIWLVVILGAAGILSTTGFITFSTEIWALMLVAGIMGLFVGRKFF